jgi:translocation and assembly module TamB
MMGETENEQTNVRAVAPPRRRRLLGWLWRLILVLVVLVAAGLAVLVGTETGLRSAVGLAQSAMPGRLSLQSLSGRLIGPLELRGLRFADASAVVELDRVAFDWRPGELLAGRVHVSVLELQGVRVTPGEARPAEPESASEPTRLPDIALPVEIVIDRLEVSDARLVKEGVPPLENAVLRARASGSELTVGELKLRLPRIRVALAGSMGLAAGTASDLRLDWTWDAPQGGSLTGAGRVTGLIDALQIEHRVSGAAEVALRARVEGLPAALRWDATLDLVRVEPALLVADVPALTVTGQLGTRGLPSDLSAEGSLRIDDAQLGPHQIDLAATLAGDQVRLQRLDVTQPDAPAKLSATGKMQLAGEREFAVEAHWNALQWPPRGTAMGASPGGRLEVSGRPSAFRFAAQGMAVAPQAPATTFGLTGTGDEAQARIDRLLLELLGGSVELTGEVGWAGEPRWDLRVALAGIDPGAQWREWPGRLGGNLVSRGRIGADGPDAVVEIASIEGKLRDYPVKLAAAAQMAGAAVKVDRLTLNSGSVRIEAAGNVADTLDLRWSVDARDLAELLPNAAGTLTGDGRLTGSRDQPRVVAKLQGSALRFQDNGVSRLALDADLGVAPDAPLRLDLAASGIAAAGKAIGDLAAKANGTQRAHRFTLDLTGGETGIGGSIALAGSVTDEQAWTGRLERTELRTGQWGDWRLQRPADLLLGATTKVAPVCLASGEARVCVDGGREATGDWRGGLDVSTLPLALVQPYLPKDTTIAGAVTAKAAAAGTASGALTADVKVALPGARIRMPMGGEVRDLDLSKGTVTARVDGKGARGEARLFLGDLASVDAKADLPGWTPQAEPARQRLGGALQARVPDIAFVKAFAPDLGTVSGQVALALDLDGTLAKPRVKGQGGLTNGRVEVPDAGLNVRDLRLTVRSQGGDRLDYDGAARSGEGDLRITGQTVLDPSQNWPTSLQVGGRDFTVFDTAEFLVLVSPDLRLKSSKDGSVLEGEVLVPRATIRPAALPKGTVAPSADVRIKGKESPDKAVGPPITTRVRLRLGDYVRVDAFQLRARLEGNLLVEQQPGKDPVGNGRLGIAEGTYSGLGKDLSIQRGELNYASSPLDNPGLNVRAVTETPEVTAGMIMTGTAREPKIELFSKPPRPQSEVLSYLLFGKPLSGTGKDDQGTITNAAGALGSQLLASQIGRQLGLDELSVSGTGDKAALTVGQYVTPQLYLQYVSGLRSQINRLRMRYDVTRWLQVQTETGDQQGGDIFYIFER